jgi:hypothetical protein
MELFSNSWQIPGATFVLVDGVLLSIAIGRSFKT